MSAIYDFTYDFYSNLIGKLKENSYNFVNYHNYKDYDKVVILRHDIDMKIGSAVKMAELEKKLGVSSTYFVLITSDFYNVYSKESLDGLKIIQSLGHEVGLHFDELRYDDCNGNQDKVRNYIAKESEILSKLLDTPVTAVSYHRPSQNILKQDLIIPNIVNSYAQVFFHYFKYVSDSRRNWREPIIDIVEKSEVKKLHILTHPFWYKNENLPLKETLEQFLLEAGKERYCQLNDNFKNLDKVLSCKKYEDVAFYE